MTRDFVEVSESYPSTVNLEAWFERAVPLYIQAYQAFMVIVKENKGLTDEIIVESNAFYEALSITTHLLNDDKLINELTGALMSPLMASEVGPQLDEVKENLLKVEVRCVIQEGAMCISPSDLTAFITTMVNVVSELGNQLAQFVTSFIGPFNKFIRDFDSSTRIDLVEGEYHLMIEQRAEELQESAGKLQAENLKLGVLLDSKSKERTAEPEVYVVCDHDDLSNYVKIRWNSRAILTSHAEAAMKGSAYANIKKLISVFDHLCNDFYRVYYDNISIEGIKSSTVALGVEFKPSMSDTTMGRYSIYDRQYKGRKADFNRHLCIGTSRRPEHCYRIHFEWDKEEKKIVIHHAGEHLPTSSS